MTDSPKEAPVQYDPANLLEGITAEELLQLDGKVFPIFDTQAHTVKRIDETTIILDEGDSIHDSDYVIHIDPDTGKLYFGPIMRSDAVTISEDNGTIRQAIKFAINLMRRGLSLDLETKWNDGDENWTERGGEISERFDRIMDWLKQQVIRAMNETNFGEADSDTVTISFNSSDKSSRTMKDLERITQNKAGI